jgi:hypothetical protein
MRLDFRIWWFRIELLPKLRIVFDVRRTIGSRPRARRLCPTLPIAMICSSLRRRAVLACAKAAPATIAAPMSVAS